MKSQLQKRLLELCRADLQLENAYQLVHPTGSQQPWMHELPKSHKPAVLLHQILSMTDSANYALSK